jgi:hypothetical protein
MTLNTVGKTPGEVQADTLQLLQSLDYDAIASTVPGVNSATVRGAEVPVSPTTAPANIDNDVSSYPAGSASPSSSSTSTPTPTTTQLNEALQSSDTMQINETTAPTIQQTQTEPPKNPVDSEGLAWWRWFIFALILVAAMLAIYVVYRKCDSQPHGGGNPVQAGASHGADASQSDAEVGMWE